MNESQQFEKSAKPHTENYSERVLPKKNTDGMVVDYSVQTSLTEKHVRLFDGGKRQIGDLIFSIPSKDPQKFRVQDARIDLEERGNGFGLELYKELISLAKKENMKGIVSANHVSYAASAVWKKLADEGYALTVNPDAQDQYDDFCKGVKRENPIGDGISINGGGSVFEITI